LHPDAIKNNKVTSVHGTKSNGKVEVYIHSFLTLALDGGEWSTPHPSHLTSKDKAPRTLYLGG